MKKLLFVAMLLSLAGCTDACVGKLQAYSDPARVTCYSGGKLIFDDCSTGKVASEQQSDGYFFRAKSTQRPVEVAGNCVVAYNEACPTNPVISPRDHND